MKNKQLRVIMVVVFALILAVTGLTTKTMLDANKQFSQDGYVLVPSRDTEVTTNVNEQYYFSAGTNYRKKYGQTIEFKDTSNKEVSMGTEEFVHYNDGSLGAFTKGVVMDLVEIGDNQVTYYGVSDKTTILKQGQDYSMSYLGNSLTLNEFIWKIADDTFMLVSPEITLHLTDEIEVVLEDYVQVQYVAGGIARLIHQRGTYQTVSDDAYIKTDSGFELKLTERAFYNGLEKAVSLDEMVIDSSSNLLVDENEESLKIPTFRVVNGKDGEDGADGFTGEDGLSGEDGTSGDNGDKGQNGFDGLEGNSGEWGYDGQVGEDGKDAEHSESADGIVGIVQESAPTIAIDAESYKVGTNSVDMMLKINDPNAMLTSDDLVCTIYKRDDMTQVYQTTISTGMTGGSISTQNLEPGVDYVFIVEGSYESDANGLFSGVNFLTKIFRTDELGLSIEKVQVTEDSIIVKTVKTDDSLVSTYGIALYLGDDTTNITSLSTNSYTDGTEFIFKTNENVVTGTQITPDTEYTIQLTNITAFTDENKTSFSNVGADVSKTVRTLKTKPYYLAADGVTKVQVSEKDTKILTSSRYQTATVSADTSIIDEHSGIKGYRYELYETATDATTITTPVQTKEVQTMETVTFNIEPDKRYFARVVVLFNDNEKEVELVTNPSDIVSLAHSNYPTVQFINLEHEYDKVSGYVMVEDNSVDQDMLLGHVSASYPLILTVTAQTGSMHTVKLSSGVTPPAGNADTGDSVEYYYFEVDGLARDITHTVSVSGYVNDTRDFTWDQLSPNQKLQKLQYLSGYNINVGSPTPIVLSMRQVPNVDDNLFTIAVAFTDNNGEDASYEVGNMEKITFRLVNAAGVTIGTTANMMDADYDKHSSDYSDYYAGHTIAVEDLPYSAEAGKTYSKYVLTDESFGAKGDLRIANGGDFKIYVEKAYDYTQQNIPEFAEFTNELDISGELEFEVKKSHARVADPNSAVEVVQIRNDNTDEPDANLDDDTIVGLTVDTGYSLDDVHQIIYYVYELTSATGEPLVKDDNPDDVLNKTINEGYWSSTNAVIKQKTINITTAADAGEPARPWTVYFDETDPTQATANLDDGGNTIFERGKVYFIRYEIVTDGTMEDTQTEKKYPHCAYDGMTDMTVPFYRSNVFGIERQEPTLQRYLWDTVTLGDGTTTHQWKYKLDDPDNAILAYVSNNKANATAKIVQYANFEYAFAAENGTESAVLAYLSAIYDDSTIPQPKTTYEIVDVTGLENGQWYTLEIPYCLFEADTRVEYASVNAGAILSAPYDVTAVSHINTAIASVNNSTTDYAVDGVMVKEVSDIEGIDDEYGYRIKITLQGSQIEKVAGLKVTVTGNDDLGASKTVIYDPVPVEIQNGTNGAGANYFGYAYLEYAPIVKAGINHRDTTIKVEAYYNTNRGGMYSFTEYMDIAHTDGYTANDNQFANANAWALKQYEYTEENGITSYQYNYQKLVDELGVLQKCQVFYKDVANTGIVTNALEGSVFIPRMSVDGSTNIGFADERTLAFKYAASPLAYTELTDDSFSDVMYLKEMTLEMDEVGARGTDGTEYYVVEQLARKTLKIDFGNPGEDFEEATFHTGDGMPGISYSLSGSSSGMSSVTAQFDIKGALPGTDKGYYIYLYKKGTTTLIPLEKYRDANGDIYYLADGADPTTDQDVLLASNDTTSAYGLETDTNSDGKKVTFAIRGLERSTEYQIKVMAKDTQNNMQDLFDYKYEEGGRYYEFKTKSNVVLVSSGSTFVYNSYRDKLATFQYAVQGSEGTGMRIFYKVYDANGNEVKCGLDTETSHGYMLEPLGNQVKYYQSDMTLSNPARLDFSPNGPLRLGQTYTIEYTAYTSTNAGAVTNATEPIGFLSKQFTMPTELKAPRASLRVVSGSNSVSVTVVMYDTEKTIYDGKFYIDAYDLAGNRITDDSTRLTVNVTAGNGSTVYSGAIQGLPENQSYRIVVSAPIDRNNDGVIESTYTNELTANTISTATATVSTSYTETGYLTLKLMDLVNFTNVDKVVYSIDSQDGATNYENVSKNLSQWTQVGNTYSYTTGFAPESGTYHYTLQFYNGSSLIGSTSGYFTK